MVEWLKKYCVTLIFCIAYYGLLCWATYEHNVNLMWAMLVGFILSFIGLSQFRFRIHQIYTIWNLDRIEELRDHPDAKLKFHFLEKIHHSHIFEELSSSSNTQREKPRMSRFEVESVLLDFIKRKGKVDPTKLKTEIPDADQEQLDDAVVNLVDRHVINFTDSFNLELTSNIEFEVM